MKAWQLWIDTGGTFTDCLAVSPTDVLSRLKILSSSVVRGSVKSQPDRLSIQVEEAIASYATVLEGFTIRFHGKKSQERKITSVDQHRQVIYLDEPISVQAGSLFELTSYEEVPVLAARLLTGTPLGVPFPPIDLKLGSTRGTNALLERKGASTAFVVTRGFKDLLTIGYQQRPDLFALDIRKPGNLYDHVVEVGERMNATGEPDLVLTDEEVARVVHQVLKKKTEAVAIALINSYRNPAHEKKLAEALRSAGIAFISLSHELSPQIRIVPRAETAVANAYLHPVIHHYLSRIRERISFSSFQVMSSAGSLMPAGSFQPKDSLLSGPAGGVIGAMRKARLSGHSHIVTFDMGGTSTDVSLCHDRPEYRFESVVGDQRILSPSLAIETIAAGGGSICDFDGHRFTVGPESAGAYPGPACYGAGGPLTITDVNLLLGRLDDTTFSVPLIREAAQARLRDIQNRVHHETGRAYADEIILEAFVQIANEKMAEAIRKVSIQKGYDPQDYTLLSFGGAGGQHACSLATILGSGKVLVPYDAGLLSAYGIGHAQVEHVMEQLILQSMDAFLLHYENCFDDLLQRGRQYLRQQGHSTNHVETEKLVFARLKGQESSLEIMVHAKEDLIPAFKKQYKKIFGHWITGRPIEVESVRLRLVLPRASENSSGVKPKVNKPKPLQRHRIFHAGKWHNSQVYLWEQLQPGASLAGPALVISKNSTQFIEPGWKFYLEPTGNAIVSRTKNETSSVATVSEEAQLELFTNRFTAIAHDMGAMLQRTAFSVNVKERLDFSCALLDAQGQLIVNAPHIPVHLGSLGVCVRALMKVIDMKEGDVVITNHPAYGGSHLPDITLVKPVYYQSKRIGFVANRAHHAEIGGKQPGSMPADATCLEEEGVVISPMYLVRKGKPDWKAIEQVLTTATYPTRALHENLADLNAALAALQYGDEALQSVCRAHGVVKTTGYMRKLSDYAAALMKQRIRHLSNKEYKAIERLDDGAKLQVTIRRGRKLQIDFSGTASSHSGDLHATTAIVNSVVLYVLRLLLGKNVPLNEGLLQDVSIKIPTCILNPKFYKDNRRSPAVVGGNTEVSQRLTDTLLKAFGLAACSQGTMNNLLFGNDRFGYYETICGGTGAGPGFNGQHAVHQHMTNTRITDPEVMEWRYPVRLNRFEIRAGSGGKGKFKGGDGIIRELEFMETLQLNVLTQHRIVSPYGLKGGEPGKTGEQELVRANGKRKKLKPVDGVTVHAGDRLIIKTPGGGGYGKR
jgi:5-oxoprolinase (ATP-hydrolysing)